MLRANIQLWAVGALDAAAEASHGALQPAALGQGWGHSVLSSSARCGVPLPGPHTPPESGFASTAPLAPLPSVTFAKSRKGEAFGRIQVSYDLVEGLQCMYVC